MRLPPFRRALALAVPLALGACFGSTQVAPAEPNFTESRGRVLSAADEGIRMYTLRYLPGGREVVYAAAFTTGGGPPALVAVDLDSGRRRILHTGLFGYINVYVLPDALLFGAATGADETDANGIVTRPDDGWGYYRLPLGGGPPEPLIAPGGLGSADDVENVLLAPDSTHLAYTTRGQLFALDLATRAVRPLASVLVGPAGTPVHFTADGTALVAPVPGDRPDTYRQIAVADGAAGPPRPSGEAMGDLLVHLPPLHYTTEIDGWGLHDPLSSTYERYNETLYLLDGDTRREIARIQTRSDDAGTGYETTPGGLTVVAVAPDRRGAAYLIKGRLYTNRLP